MFNANLLKAKKKKEREPEQKRKIKLSYYAYTYRHIDYKHQFHLNIYRFYIDITFDTP